MTIDDKIRDEKPQYDINREAAKISALWFRKINECEYLTDEETLPPDQSSVIEQTKFSYSPLGKVFEKETKMTEEKDEKQIDAITDQKKRLETLSNKDDHKSIDKKIFDRVVIERFDEIKELTNEIDHDDLIYHFKNNTNKNINDFDDGIELFQKIQSGEMN